MPNLIMGMASVTFAGKTPVAFMGHKFILRVALRGAFRYVDAIYHKIYLSLMRIDY
jgi:hypothetical protein